MFFLSCEKFMQNVGIAGAITKGPRGGRNLYGSVPWERARGLACEKGEIKRVIKGGRLRLLYFSRKGVRKCRQNPITQAGAAVRDPVREGKSLRSRRKPRTAIRADGSWKCWTFPKSRVSICQSPMSFLSAEQRDGSTLQAEEIYTETWEWLKKVGCAAKVSPQLLERYAMCSARWIQCEEMTNRMGFLSKHPTTQKPIPSPFINIGINYMNQAVRLWNEIFQIVKENCSTDYGEVSPQDDLMERLLRARKG